MRWTTNIALVFALALPAGAQTDYGYRLGRQEKGEVRFNAQGPSVLMGALDPTVMRWYMPQELFDEYGRRQWCYTNYATEPYRRYIDRNQEGTYFYDTYGKLISRGWLVYDWRQTQARTVESSQLTKERALRQLVQPADHLIGCERRLQLLADDRRRDFRHPDTDDLPQGWL